jgi:hypothetical protein
MAVENQPGLTAANCRQLIACESLFILASLYLSRYNPRPVSGISSPFTSNGQGTDRNSKENSEPVL